MRTINRTILLQFHRNRLAALSHRAQVTLQSQGLKILLRKLLTRRDDASSQPALDPPHFHADASRPRADARILVIDTALPQPDRDSGSMRALQLLQLIQKCGYEIDFLTERPHQNSSYLHTLQAQGVHVLPLASIRAFHSALKAGAHYTSIIVCRYHLAEFWLPLLRSSFPNARLILDTVDLHHLREQGEANLKKNKRLLALADQTKCRELAAIYASDATWVVSPKEQEALQSYGCKTPVFLVPNLHTPSAAHTSFEQRSGLLFVGGAGHPPNVDAVNWLINDILPQILSVRQDIPVHLVGTELSTVLPKELPHGVICHDYVADLSHLLATVRIGIAPLRFGAGVKGKVSQCLAHGLPVVVTSCAAEGMHLHHEKNALIADDASTFATNILRLHDDPVLWNLLSCNGSQVIQEHFSPTALLATLQASLNTNTAS